MTIIVLVMLFMKLLINICSYDGISSHYSGVGTIVKRFIESLYILKQNNVYDFDLNLITAENNTKSLGYNEKIEKYYNSMLSPNIIKVSNGSGGQTNFGTIENWNILSANTADVINNLDFSKYDKVLTIAHDTPYCSLFEQLNLSSNHVVVWIPHSTVKIHGQSSDIGKSNYDLIERFNYEFSAIDFINNHTNCFVGITGNFITNHLVYEYDLSRNKIVKITNGEVLEIPTIYDEPSDCERLFEKIKGYKEIILSLGRAEKYKNLEATMLLGDCMKIKPVVVAQSYYKGQPIINDYKKLAEKTSTTLYVDVPFTFPQYIIKYFTGKIILLVPSKKEIMGLVFNEIRKFNKDNILIVANDIDGIKEQVEDGIDGLLVDLDDISASAQKILKFFNLNDMKAINKNSQLRLKRDYDYVKNCTEFLQRLVG